MPDQTPDQTSTTPQPGDRIRVLSTNQGADPEFTDWAIGRTGTLRGRVGNLYRIEFDEPFHDERTWHVTDVAPARGTTANGSPIVPKGTTVIIDEVYGPRPTYELGYIGRRGTTDSQPDDDDDVRVIVQLDDGTTDFTYARRWHLPTSDTKTAGQAAESTASEATTEQTEAQAKDQYTKLGQAIIHAAVENDWCDEFTTVMSEAGFEDISCGRVQEWDLTVQLEYTIDGVDMDRMIRDEFEAPDADCEPVNITSTVHVNWTGQHPEDLDTGRRLNDLLEELGYSGHDIAEVIDHNNEGYGDDEFVPDLGQHPTWVARYDALIEHVMDQARERQWGQILSDVFTSAGIERPKSKIYANVKATKTVYRYGEGAYAKALRDDPDVGYLTLTKHVDVEIDNPYTGSECRCENRETSQLTGNKLLPGPIREPITAAAKAKITELFGPGSGWTAKDSDVEVSCAYCI